MSEEESKPAADMAVSIDGRQVRITYSMTRQVQQYEPHSMTAEVAWSLEAGTAEDLIDAIRAESLVLRSAVLEQLEVPIEINDDGVISIPRSEGKSERKSSSRGSSKRSSGGSRGGSKKRKSYKATDEDWEDLMDNPDDWYDNRDSKPTDRSPDFRHKEDKDRAMWMNSAPDWFDEEEFDDL